MYVLAGLGKTLKSVRCSFLATGVYRFLGFWLSVCVYLRDGEGSISCRVLQGGLVDCGFFHGRVILSGLWDKWSTIEESLLYGCDSMIFMDFGRIKTWYWINVMRPFAFREIILETLFVLSLRHRKEWMEGYRLPLNAFNKAVIESRTLQ